LAVSIIALAIGALNVLTALVMAIQERTREIGIFGAIGWSSPRIITSIVIEGVLMCAIGCILGALLSFAVALVFPNIPGIGDLISFKPRVAVIAPIMVAAFALCILGSLLPAWQRRAARSGGCPSAPVRQHSGGRSNGTFRCSTRYHLRRRVAISFSGMEPAMDYLSKFELSRLANHPIRPRATVAATCTGRAL
jgi:hypothetical protein